MLNFSKKASARWSGENLETQTMPLGMLGQFLSLLVAASTPLNKPTGAPMLPRDHRHQRKKHKRCRSGKAWGRPRWR